MTDAPFRDKWTELRSGTVMVCHKERITDAGPGTVWSALLSDGFLIDCGSGPTGKARANTLASIINAGGPDQWQRLGHDALKKWKPAPPSNMGER